MTVKLLNNNKLLNIMKNAHCVLCVKNYLLKIMEDVFVGILGSRVILRKLFLVKLNSIFVADYYNGRNAIFPFTDVLSVISLYKKS